MSARGDMFIANDPVSRRRQPPAGYCNRGSGLCRRQAGGLDRKLAHHSDIGGKVPGSTSGDADSLFQEGIRIPVIRIRENNETISSVLDLLLDNTRVPQEREGGPDCTDVCKPDRCAENPGGICPLPG